MVYGNKGIINGLKQVSKGLPRIGVTVVNFKLSIVTGTGDVTFDDWGNPILTEMITEILEGNLRETKPPIEEANPGLNRNRFYLTGRLFNPLVYPFPWPQVCEAEYLFADTWRKGKFYPWEKLHEGLNEIILTDLAFGQDIHGFFELEEGN